MNPIRATVDARKFFALAPFASTEKTRYYLAGVCLQPDAGGNILVATDGHILGVFVDETGQWTSQDGTGELIVKIDPDLANAAKRLLKTKEAARLVIEQDDSGAATVTLQSGGAPEMSKYKQSIAGTFPDWRRLVPEVRDPAEPRGIPAVNITYIKKFEGIAKASKTLVVRLDPGKTDADAIRVFVGDPDFLGVIMPMRYSTEAWNWS